MVSKSGVPRRHTFPGLPFFGPIAATLESHFRGYFLQANMFTVCGDPFTYLLIRFIFSQSYCSGLQRLGTHSYSALWIWPVNCPIVELVHGASAHSTFLNIPMFTRRFPGVSHLLEVISTNIHLNALPSRCPSPLVKTLFLLVASTLL